MYVCITGSLHGCERNALLNPYLVRSKAWRLPLSADTLQPRGHTDVTESQELDDQYRPCGPYEGQLHQVK